MGEGGGGEKNKVSEDNPEKKYILDMQNRILPFIVKCISSNDRAVRYHILSKIDEWIAFVDNDLVNNKIFPPL